MKLGLVLLEFKEIVLGEDESREGLTTPLDQKVRIKSQSSFLLLIIIRAWSAGGRGEVEISSSSEVWIPTETGADHKVGTES